MKKILQPNPIFLLFLLLLVSSAARASYPLVKNFTRYDYRSADQNWSIEQDEQGRMYFGNKDALLVFNGNSWEKFYLENYTTVRALSLQDDGKLYAGGTNTFGYFTPDSINGMIYHSLVPTLGNSRFDFNEIWNIHTANGHFWFQSDFHLFNYDKENNTTSVVPFDYKLTTSAMIGDKLYVALLDKGIWRVDELKSSPLEGNELLQGKRVNALLPLRGQILIVTDFDGLYMYEEGRIHPFPTIFDSFLKESQVFCAATQDGKVAFGTVSHGILIVDFNGKEVAYANRHTGMQNNTVLSIYFDRNHNVWCGLDNGIDYILQNSPISNLMGSGLIIGAGYVSKLIDRTLYLGTNQGLFAIPYPIPPSPNLPRCKELLKGQIWDLEEIDGTLFVCADGGLFSIRNGVMSDIPGLSGTHTIKKIPGRKGCAIASTYDNYYLLTESGGKWKVKNPISGFSEFTSKFIFDDFDNLWISHWLKGIYRIHLDQDLHRFDNVQLYDNRYGLPSNDFNSICSIGDNIYFSTRQGLYAFDYHQNKMIAQTLLNRKLPLPKLSHIFQDPEQNVWSLSASEIVVANYTPSGTYDLDSVTFTSLADKLIPGFEHLNFVRPGTVIFSCRDGFYELNDNKLSFDLASPSDLFVSRVIANNDSTVYYDILGSPIQSLTLPYDLNTLKFEVATPEYRADKAVSYSFFLDDFDKEWSPLSLSAVKEYTRLPEGDYTLHVRSVNTYDRSNGETILHLKILPPWYRSIWAKIFYLLLILGAGCGCYYLIRHMARQSALALAQQKEKDLMEQRRIMEKETLEKDYEIEQLKSAQLEQDIRQKSEEISRTTMNIAQKNELLIEISKRIDKIKELNATGQKENIAYQSGKIQNIIKENMSRDRDMKDFTKNFDIAYENFTKILLERHPDLTPGDRLICCYLKMGLSSKEIAPLLNISFRSVEMRRYRLRQKLNLEHDDNLIDYIQKI